MWTRAILGFLSLLFAACASTIEIQGYPLRPPRPDESQQVAVVLDPLLMGLDLPPLRTIAMSKGCKIGFAVARTDKVNVWSSPSTTSPCLYFTLLVTEGALMIPTDQLMATIAHELGHLVLHHTPEPGAPSPAVSSEHWQAIQGQELAADRFAIALLKRSRALYEVGSCEAMAQFLRRSVPEWYGERISPRMQEALDQRIASADTACAAPGVDSVPVADRSDGGFPGSTLYQYQPD